MESCQLNLSSANNLFHDHSRSVRHQDQIEDSYYLRRNQSFYLHILNSYEGQKEVQSLFLSEFYKKVLNAVAMTRSSNDSFLMWLKSPCDSVAPKLTNVWTTLSGLRKGFIIHIFIKNDTLIASFIETYTRQMVYKGHREKRV